MDEPLVDRLKAVHLLTAFILILTIGTLGYQYLEGWSTLDSFFMTVITITTVGYREVGGPLSASGKIFTTFLIFSGFGVAALALSHITGIVMKGELNKTLGKLRMENRIRNLKDHYLIAGFGRTGQVIASHFDIKKIPYVVIDSDPRSIERLKEQGIAYVFGDAADEDTLHKAGVERAAGFVAVVSNDANNAFSIMTAKGLNPNLNIIARALDSQSIRKLKMAGAKKVIAPYVLGGMRIAQTISHPHAADFIDIVEDVRTKDIEMVDIRIGQGSKLDGASLGDGAIRDLGVIVVGLRKADGQFVFQPVASTKISHNDHLILMGPNRSIEKVYELFEST